MAPMDMDKMKKKREESQRGGEFSNFEEGETKCYVMPPCRDDDDDPLTAGTNFLPVGVHYGVGKERKMVVCLDPNVNPIIKHPFVKEVLAKRGIKLTGDTCPVCEELPRLSEDEQKDQRFQVRYLWGIIPMAFRRSKRDEWREQSPKACIHFGGKTVHDGIVDIICEEGDITQFDNAIFIKVTRKGSKKNDTRYQVDVDTDCIREPVRLGKAVKRLVLDALKEDCNLFRVVGNMLKATGEVKAAISGIPVEEDDDDDDAEPTPKKPSKPPCFGLDFDGSDPECSKKCTLAKACAAKCGVEAEADEEEAPPKKRRAAVEDDEEEAPPKRRVKAPEPEDDEDEPPKKRVRAPVEDDDEDEPAPEPRRSRKTAAVDDDDDLPGDLGHEGKGKRKAAASEDDGIDELDEELATLSKKKRRAG